MKTYCRHIDPADVDTIIPFIWDCYRGHGNGTGKWKRNDYASFLASYSDFSVKEVKDIAECGLYGLFSDAIRAIAEDVSRRITNRALDLPPVRYEARADGMSGKIRELGHEPIMQQVMEHIAVCCLKELFDAKFSPNQYASIAGKGQVAGMRKIRAAARRDCHGRAYAAKHGRTYHPKYRFHAKTDIRQCYPSMKKGPVMALLRRDIGKNEILLWFIESLLDTHLHGFIIGSILSQYLCNYVLSYAYREVMSLHKERRGKRVKLVTFALFFMDDMLMMSSDRRNLKMAIRQLDRYLKCAFGLDIKGTWHIKDWQQEPVDMMGYKVYCNGKVCIRAKIFLRSRAAFRDRESLPLAAARRLLAYNGYFTHSNSYQAKTALKVAQKSAAAMQAVSIHDQKEVVYKHERRKRILQRLSERGIYPVPA